MDGRALNSFVHLTNMLVDVAVGSLKPLRTIDLPCFILTYRDIREAFRLGEHRMRCSDIESGFRFVVEPVLLRTTFEGDHQFILPTAAVFPVHHVDTLVHVKIPSLLAVAAGILGHYKPVTTVMAVAQDLGAVEIDSVDDERAVVQFLCYSVGCRA